MLLAATFVQLSACRQAALPPIEDSSFHLEADEHKLWRQADDLDWAIGSDQLVYRDEALQRYVDEVASRLLEELGAGGVSVRVRVIRDPFLNAFALPNGSIYLHTGMFAHIQNEAQLATIIGHELAHFFRRHGANLHRARSSRYSRKLEREADELGLNLLLRAGYDPNEAPKVFVQMLDQNREAGLDEPYHYGSHPRLHERIEHCRALIDRMERPTLGQPWGKTDREQLEAVIPRLLLDNARLDMSIGRFEAARRAIDRHLAWSPRSAPGYAALGELHRRSGDGREHLRAAAAALEQATQLDAAAPEPHRELALIRWQLGESDAAKAEFEVYLELAPGALDRSIIEGYFDQLAEEH